MAITYNLSSLLVNTYAVPPVANQTGVDVGRIKTKIATVSYVPGDSIGSIYRVCRVRSADIITNILQLSTVTDATLAGNLGLYNTYPAVTLANSVALNVRLFSTLGGAAFTTAKNVDFRFNALAATTAGQRVWQLLGLSADPELVYDLCFTTTAVATGSSTFAIQYNFVD